VVQKKNRDNEKRKRLNSTVKGMRKSEKRRTWENLLDIQEDYKGNKLLYAVKRNKMKQKLNHAA
jgi:hypothetical protein